MNKVEEPDYDPLAYLARPGPGRTVFKSKSHDVLFTQGDAADAVFFVTAGRIKLTTLSEQGRTAVVAILGPDDFLGQECLTKEPEFLKTAVALSDCQVMRIEKDTFMDALYEEPELAQMFVSYLLARVTRVEQDLADQMINTGEMRLARALLLLADAGNDGQPDPVVPNVSQQTLADLIGTTRSRVSFFMNDFRKRGLIDYVHAGAIEVHTSKLNHALFEMAGPGR
jgi:CRP-like cAMP-binding protein